MVDEDGVVEGIARWKLLGKIPREEQGRDRGSEVGHGASEAENV